MTPRLNKILSRFHSTQKELEKLAAQAEAEIASHDQEISERTAIRNELAHERVAALGVANKIQALIAA